ncbi:transcriptional regulator with XRE-family HTH domain [Paenibacillus sp. JGP012]|uniref:helix-turn-helix domain-containing protein n=1 Tax=Paenibacillus sp. JGP012 TaxID=2735914 RepID=UPI0016158972|nr:helix-turn-helix transcriptional regulator [Paenibacillus sp. JGP012]MBB6019642.1 transcriptional regulator with XRE-family HTH domain [Paenibacillus sp. JGP012]
MDWTNSIREKLIKHIQDNRIKHSHFAMASGINSGTLSRILQGNRPISMNQLAAIISGMGLPEDYFYNDYVEECFSFSISIRRIRPFIFRCADLDRLDCIRQVTILLLEDLSYVSVLFDIAEELFANNKHLAAAILYRGVCEAEKYQHSERLAICQYRLFVIDLGEDIEENVRAATQFETYVNRLDETYQLEALKLLMNVFGTAHKWEKVNTLAVEMQRIATIQYEWCNRSVRPAEVEKGTERPLYYYILYAYLAQATASEKCGDYKRALELVSLYDGGESWIREKDEQAQQIIRQFSEWAVANTYLYRLMSGEVHIIHDYANYIATREAEIFTALWHMIQAANLYHFNIDAILERFAEYIPYQSEKAEFGEYKPAIIKERYVQFLGDLAVYRFNESKDIHSATELMLEGLNQSIAMGSSKIMTSCLAMFEKIRDHLELLKK